jgi:hypothetical protein
MPYSGDLSGAGRIRQWHNQSLRASHSRCNIHHLPKTITYGGFLMEFEGYCVKCRTKRTITDGVVEETAQGRRMAKGTCPVCGTKVTRFLSSKDKE